MTEPERAAPTLQQQAAAVERMAVNHRGFVERLRVHVGARKRTQEELALQEALQPELEAAARTMRRLAEKAKQRAGELGQ